MYSQVRQHRQVKSLIKQFLRACIQLRLEDELMRVFVALLRVVLLYIDNSS